MNRSSHTQMHPQVTAAIWLLSAVLITSCASPQSVAPDAPGAPLFTLPLVGISVAPNPTPGPIATPAAEGVGPTLGGALDGVVRDGHSRRKDFAPSDDRAGVTEVVEFRGAAHDAVTGRLLYVGHYKFSGHGEDPLRFQCRFESPEGTVLGEFDSVYGKRPYLPDLTIQHPLEHEKISMTLDLTPQGGLNLTFMSQKTDVRNQTVVAPDTSVLKATPGTMTGDGAFFYIRDHLNELLNGKMEQVRLVVPSRKDDYAFRIYVLSGREPESNLLKIRFEPDYWLIRLFAPNAEFDYDKKNRRIVEYRGPAEVPDLSGKFSKVRVTYDYLPPAQAPVDGNVDRPHN